MDPGAPRQPHSAEHFGDARDLWWHADFLDLIGCRSGLGRCRTMLDLGAGKGHWTALVAARCAPDAAITAIDFEPEWIEALNRRFSAHPHFTAIAADVTDLSGICGPYDLVTCQTLLLHLPVAKVDRLLRAALRLLAPGGLLLLAEPDNFANRMTMTSVTCDLDPAGYGTLAAFWWAFELGRKALGFGEEWIATLLPKLIADAGFADLRVYANDRASPIVPDAGAQSDRSAADIAEIRNAWSSQAQEAEIRRFVLAGGLDEAAFQLQWSFIRALEDRTAEAAIAGRLSGTGADHLFVFAARKPD